MLTHRRPAPLVTVGLPVHDGENFLQEAIGSILSQDQDGVELVISDNASSDATEEICRQAAADHPDVIRYARSDVNRGAAWNYNEVVRLASGRFFKWAAHDDVIAPAFLRRCIDVLQDDATVSLCYTRAVSIDAQGGTVEAHPSFRYADGLDPVGRARAVLASRTPCFEVFGVMRLAQLRQTGLIGPYASSDRTLLFELALLGRFHEVPAPLFLHRQHAQRSVRRYRTTRSRDTWFDPRRGARFTLPRWRLVGEHVRVLGRVPLGPADRVRCAGCLVPWTAGMASSLGREAAGLGGHLARHLATVVPRRAAAR